MEAFEKKLSREEWMDSVRNKPTHGPTLADYWRTGLKYHDHVKETPGVMSMKYRKMLKTLVAALPDVGYLENVLANWGHFKTFAYEYDVKLPNQIRIESLAHCVDAIIEFRSETSEETGDLLLQFKNPYIQDADE